VAEAAPEVESLAPVEPEAPQEDAAASGTDVSAFASEEAVVEVAEAEANADASEEAVAEVAEAEASSENIAFSEPAHVSEEVAVEAAPEQHPS
jgi:hypothetical protein